MKPPLTVVMILATGIGLVAGLIVGQGLASQVTMPAPHIELIVPTAVPTVTPTPTPLPTRTPAPTPTATSTPIPWESCAAAAVGEICIPSRVLTPSPTPTFPPCSSGQTRWVGAVELCERDR